jgi:hypothetical protein
MENWYKWQMTQECLIARRTCNGKFFLTLLTRVSFQACMKTHFFLDVWNLPYTPVYKCHQMSVSRLFSLFLLNPLSLRTDYVAKPIIPTESSRRDESNGVRFTMGGSWMSIRNMLGGTYTPVALIHRRIW